MISDYSELIAEVAARSGHAGVAARAAMFTGMAEKLLSKRLRVSGQEKTQERHSIADGQIRLPYDFQELRTLSHNGVALRRQSGHAPLAPGPLASEGTYTHGPAEVLGPGPGTSSFERNPNNPADHTVIARYLADRPRSGPSTVTFSTLISSYPSSRHIVSYYSKIPSLDVEGVNWLLESEPEIYLYALLFQIYTAYGDMENAQASAAYLNSLIEAANQAATTHRFSGARVNLGRAAL